jgi:hypothetical protein
VRTTKGAARRRAVDDERDHDDEQHDRQRHTLERELEAHGYEQHDRPPCRAARPDRGSAGDERQRAEQYGLEMDGVAEEPICLGPVVQGECAGRLGSDLYESCERVGDAGKHDAAERTTSADRI